MPPKGSTKRREAYKLCTCNICMRPSIQIFTATGERRSSVEGRLGKNLPAKILNIAEAKRIADPAYSYYTQWVITEVQRRIQLHKTFTLFHHDILHHENDDHSFIFAAIRRIVRFWSRYAYVEIEPRTAEGDPLPFQYYYVDIDCLELPPFLQYPPLEAKDIAFYLPTETYK